MANSSQIRVLIRQKPDRDNLLLYYVDPLTKREKSRSAGTADFGEAERAAERWAKELEDYQGDDNAGWEYFRQRFRDEHCAFLAAKTKESYATALNRFEEYASPSSVKRINTHQLSQFAAELLKQKHPATTVRNYLGHIRAALKWAERVGMIQKAPHANMPRVTKQRHMRGRPLTPREFAKMLRASRQLYPHTHGQWRRFLKLLWLSGLRLGEAYVLAWDAPPLCVQMQAKPYPLILIDAEGQKSRQDQAAPMAPDLVAWLSRTKEKDRRGFVADVRTTTGTRFKVSKLGVRISEIGEKAGVLVQSDPEKYATAHDIRRSFATRWAAKVRPITLQRMMRHSDLSTTLKHYVGLTAADVGSELWNGKHGD